MSHEQSSWSIRTLLNPVVTRLLIQGVDPFDLERVLRHVESIPLRNARQLETTWIADWETRARAWQARGEEAAATCRLAQFLVNPGDIALRRRLYFEYASCYRTAADHFLTPVIDLEIPVNSGATMEAFLHLPEGTGPHPSVVIMSGLGSCKEEMNILARLAVDRGLAAIVPDMPGSGSTLLRRGVNCGSDNISHAIARRRNPSSSIGSGSGWSPWALHGRRLCFPRLLRTARLPLVRYLVPPVHRQGGAFQHTAVDEERRLVRASDWSDG